MLAVIFWQIRISVFLVLFFLSENQKGCSTFIQKKKNTNLQENVSVAKTCEDVTE